MVDLGHESPARADGPDSVNDLLCEWRDARMDVWGCRLEDKEKLRNAIDRLSNAESSLHQYAMTLGGTLTESGIANGMASRDTNSLTDGTNG